ncbi:uncharacterized protein [Oncorhynchus clarkii lewisi]|uniref:uncharacterized protein n=1 Tax=Oncorhynchus clarkii lewisi TaxID=490388 RepID=UPI0039B8B22F
MGGKGFLGCFILSMSLASVSTIKQTLISIHDLTGIEFGHTFPRHGLMLLHWLANNIHTDNNGNMRLNFNPTRGDYGFNFYGNADRPRPLPFLPSESGSYYSLGNIEGNYNYNGATALPDYVTQSFYNSWIPERNRDRVIIRVREEGSNQLIVDEVYITQHYPPNENRESVYDPDNTYPVSFSLLTQIQVLPTITRDVIQRIHNVEINDNSVENIWGHTPGLALLLAIALYLTRPKVSFIQQVFITMESQHHMQDDETKSIRLAVKTTNRGGARITFSGIPRSLLDKGVIWALYKNNDSTDMLDSSSVIDGASGSFDTSVPLNPGLQARLHPHKSMWLFKLCGNYNTSGEEIRRSSEFHDSNREIPVDISGYKPNASLQLFVKDGKACARLYVKKSFTDWKEKFNNSWVGFYSSEKNNTNEYNTYQWQWAVKFSEESRSDWKDIPEYDVYVYRSSMPMSPGVQARFMLEKSGGEKARTPPWEVHTSAI